MAGGRRYESYSPATTLEMWQVGDGTDGSYSPATTLEMWQVGDGTDLIVLLLHSRCGRWETVRIL